MGIPSLREAKLMAKPSDTHTIACRECKKPLWKVKIHARYGTRTAADKAPYPGVPSYEDMWTKDGQPVDTKCPFCKQDYFQVVQLPNKTLAAIPYVIEFSNG